MPHSIALNFEDGVTRVIEARDGETVADASYRLGINIPLDCRDGACGTCKCRVACGVFDFGDYIEDALTDDEAAEGFALACQARAKSDLVVEIAASSAMCKTRAQAYDATIAAVERRSPTTLAFTLEGAGPVAFLPGQYANLRLPGSAEHRSYSFASAPGDDRLAFLIRDIPDGRMSGFLRAAAPGTPVDVHRPLGQLLPARRDAAAAVPRRRHRPRAVPVDAAPAGGEGDERPARPPRLRRHPRRRPRRGRDAGGARRPHPGLQLRHRGRRSRPAPIRARATSPITSRPEQLNAGEIDVYLCGPPPMVDAVRGWLAAQGVTPASFHTEKFAVSGAAAQPLKLAS